MKLSIKKILFIIGLFSSLSCFAQNEGFLGKEKIVNYFCSFTPYSNGYDYQGDIGGMSSGAYQLNHNIQFDYLVSRRNFVSVGLATNFTGVSFNESYSREYYDHSVENPQYYYETFNLSGFAPVSGVRIDIAYSVNASSYVSPMGFHFKFGAFCQFSTIKDPLQYTDAYQGTSSYEKLENKKFMTTVHTGILLGGHYQRVWFDNIVYKFGLDLSFSGFSAVPYLFNGSSTSADNTRYSNINIKDRYDCYKRGISREIALRNLAANIIRFNIGIGYLF